MDTIYVVQAYPLNVEQANVLSEFIIKNFGEEFLHVQKGELKNAIHQIILG